jgi:hypothetical protein
LVVRSDPATNIQLGFVRHAALVMVAEKLPAKLRTCDRREEFVKLLGIDVGESVWRRFYRARLRGVAWEALCIFRLFLSGIGHVGSDVQPSTRLKRTFFWSCRGA